MPKSYMIKKDGRDYNFTPGTNGSLISKRKGPTDIPMVGPIQKRSKVVPSMYQKPVMPRITPGATRGSLSPDLRKKRMLLAKSISGQGY